MQSIQVNDKVLHPKIPDFKRSRQKIDVQSYMSFIAPRREKLLEP